MASCGKSSHAKTQRRRKAFGFFASLRPLCAFAWKTYLSATALDADPPKLLRTVIFSGYVGQDSEALKRPLPLFFSVPTRAPLAVTYTRNVAEGSVPVASTRRLPLDR